MICLPLSPRDGKLTFKITFSKFGTYWSSLSLSCYNSLLGIYFSPIQQSSYSSQNQCMWCCKRISILWKRKYPAAAVSFSLRGWWWLDRHAIHTESPGTHRKDLGGGPSFGKLSWKTFRQKPSPSRFTLHDLAELATLNDLSDFTVWTDNPQIFTLSTFWCICIACSTRRSKNKNNSSFKSLWVLPQVL